MKKLLLFCTLIGGQLIATNHFNQAERETLKEMFHGEVDAECRMCKQYLENEDTAPLIMLKRCKKKALFLNQTEEAFLADIEAQEIALNVVSEIAHNAEYKDCINKPDHEKKYEEIKYKYIEAHRKKVKSRTDLTDQEKKKLILNFLLYLEFMLPYLEKFNIN